MPMAKLAEKVLCHRLGIVFGGVNRDVRQHVRRQAPRDTAITALCALFRLDCDLATAVEDALVGFGGASALTQAPGQEPEAAA
jgi:hypothetical protein